MATPSTDGYLRIGVRARQIHLGRAALGGKKQREENCPRSEIEIQMRPRGYSNSVRGNPFFAYRDPRSCHPGDPNYIHLFSLRLSPSTKPTWPRVRQATFLFYFLSLSLSLSLSVSIFSVFILVVHPARHTLCREPFSACAAARDPQQLRIDSIQIRRRR